MEGYLTPVVEGDNTVNRVAVEEPVSIYRADDGTHRVLVETGGDQIGLDVRDVTVSRKKRGAPVEIIPERDAIAIHNRANSNPITIERTHREVSLAEGETDRISQDCILAVGYNTRLRLTVEDERAGRTLSVDELQEVLDLDEGGSVIEGVNPAAYAASLAENLRKAGTTSANECLKFAIEAENFVEGQPVADEDYESTRETVEKFRSDIESRVNQSALRDVDITENDEWQERIERIAHRLERLYSRADTT